MDRIAYESNVMVPPPNSAEHWPLRKLRRSYKRTFASLLKPTVTANHFEEAVKAVSAAALRMGAVQATVAAAALTVKSVAIARGVATSSVGTSRPMMVGGA